MIRLVLALMVLATGALAQTPAWRLADADRIASDTYLILTVPLASEEGVSDLAAEIEATYGVTLVAEWPLQAISIHCLVVDASQHGDIDALADRMRNAGSIQTVQRMQSFDVLEVDYPDELFPLQTALGQLNVGSAHVHSTGAGVTVGVVDSGIDVGHPDLSDRMLEARDFVGATPALVGETHGTAIAGVIGADGANAAGMVGVAPGANLIGLRACWQEGDAPGRCSSFSLARALNFAVLNGIDVLNLSLGGPDDPLLAQLVEAALAAEMVVVAAWGEADAPAFPASLPGVIAAGPSAIPAPAVDVLSTAPQGQYRYVSGSSVATAHVSGVAALLLGLQGDLTAGDVAEVLAASVVAANGAPRLDACRALVTVAAAEAGCP